MASFFRDLLERLRVGPFWHETLPSVAYQSWRLFVANPVIIVPGLLATLIARLVRSILTGPHLVLTTDGDTLFAGHVTGELLALSIALVVSMLGIGGTTCMAALAWRHRRFTFAEGMRTFGIHARGLIRSIAWLIGFGFIALLFAPITLGMSLLAAGMLLLYTLPISVVRGISGFSAVRASTVLAYDRADATLLVAIMSAIVLALTQTLVLMLSFFGTTGHLLGDLVVGASGGWVMLFIMGVYLHLPQRQGAAGETTAEPWIETDFRIEQ